MKTSLIKNIQGTWLLSSMKIINDNGDIRDLFGESSIGITTFDASGYVNSQMGSLTRPKFRSEIINQGTPDEIIAAYNNYMAFFGRYREDSPNTLIIHLEGCLFPNWQGKEITRIAEIKDNLLFLSTPPTRFGVVDAVVKATWIRV
ncbi:MAG TPA: lipocalin-like domain-containing protein [Bacteroidales bacterium]|nr:lipocalin-like domain-containing protein [Bacteroidales bacterium]